MSEVFKRYVGVQHKSNDNKIFWFIVPESLADTIKLGTKVVCDTRKGRDLGLVVSIIEGAEARHLVPYRPTREIVAVEQDFELSKIHIPYDWNLASTNPSVDKISQRINEYYQSGRFKTVVLCHPDGTLRDGYTAYLVAKMFGHDTLRAFCVATENLSAGQGG